VLVALVAAVCSAVGCGSNGAPATPTTPTRVAIEVADSGPYDVAMRAPGAVAAGPVEVELRNRGDTLHDAQLFRVDGGRTGADIVGALEDADPSPKPRWLNPAGGVAPTAAGETATVTQILEPGVYYVADTQERDDPSGGNLTNAAKGGIARIEVGGEVGGDLPDTPASITAREYGYDVEGIVAGPNRVTFRNAGRQFHQAVAFRIGDDVSYREGRRAVLERRGYTGWVPVDVPHQRATTVLEGGREQVTELTFEPGRYVLLCFVSDRAGGAPQWAFGMSSGIEVPPRGASP
jgi:hypothetical protein